MKEWRMLIWLSQVGLSVAAPLAGFILISVWLKNRFQLGGWVIVLGCAAGLISAADSLRNTLKAMAFMDRKKDDEETPVSFNHHE